MKIFTTLLLISFLQIQYTFAQHEQTVFGDGGIRLTGLWGGSTNGMVKFDNNFSLNNGGYFVFELNRDFLIGWSGYGSGETLDNGKKAEIDGNDLIVGYTFNSDRAVHPALYMKGGRGTLQIAGETKDNVSVFEPSVGLEVNVFRFMRIGVEGGYRFVSGVNTSGFADQDFSSPFVGLRLKFGYSWGR